MTLEGNLGQARDHSCCRATLAVAAWRRSGRDCWLPGGESRGRGEIGSSFRRVGIVGQCCWTPFTAIDISGALKSNHLSRNSGLPGTRWRIVSMSSSMVYGGTARPGHRCRPGVWFPSRRAQTVMRLRLRLRRQGGCAV